MPALAPWMLAAAVALIAAGAAFTAGWVLNLPAVVLAIAALRARTPRRGLAWTVLVTALMSLLTTFTVRVAVPNIVSAGNAASDKVAVSTLRTFLWAEDEYTKRHGRPGTLLELAAPLTLPNGETQPAPWLNLELRPLPQGLTVFSGYAYAIHVLPGKSGHYLAYAWPVLPGKSGTKVYCLNEREDIFESDSAAITPPYESLQRQPAWNACLPPGAKPGDRPAEGPGGDGVTWRRWKGKMTRRAREG